MDHMYWNILQTFAALVVRFCRRSSALHSPHQAAALFNLVCHTAGELQTLLSIALPTPGSGSFRHQVLSSSPEKRLPTVVACCKDCCKESD